MNPRDIYTDSVFDFVARWVPVTQEKPRVLEVGCGRGDLALRVKTAGYDVVALDQSPEAIESASAKGVETVCGDFLGYESPPFDALVFTMSLHHMRLLDKVLNHAAGLLKPSGLLLAEDFDYEHVDEQTLSWYYFAKRMTSAAGLLDCAEDAPRLGMCVEHWQRYHAGEHQLNTGALMLQEIRDRFALLEARPGPYFYRYFCCAMEPSQRACRVAEIIQSEENDLAAAGLLLSTGLRIVARKAG